MLHETYQNIPELINPIAFSIGFLSVRWYSLTYLVAFAVIVFLLKWRIKKKESDFKWNDILDFLIYSFIGILIGGRLGYVFFYDLGYFTSNPVEIFLPVQISNFQFQVTGFYGMSYFGALLGVSAISYFFAKKRKINFWKLLDFILPAIPAGYFFGRVGNFLNGELYGRVTEKKLGMDFGDGFLRHPSQLYEAFFEGIILFVVLWILRNRFRDKLGIIIGLYLSGYGLFRFLIEFFREPDVHLGFVLGLLTLGQIFSVLIFFIGIFVIYGSKNHRVAS